MDVRRILRVSEAVKEELAEIIGFEMEDPRLLEVDVTDVQVSPDSRHAAVKVSLRGDAKQAEARLGRPGTCLRISAAGTGPASAAPACPGTAL